MPDILMSLPVVLSVRALRQPITDNPSRNRLVTVSAKSLETANCKLIMTSAMAPTNYCDRVPSPRQAWGDDREPLVRKYSCYFKAFWVVK